jgi:formylglycine-generating enzyme required for sulfatase activity
MALPSGINRGDVLRIIRKCSADEYRSVAAMSGFEYAPIISSLTSEVSDPPAGKYPADAFQEVLEKLVLERRQAVKPLETKRIDTTKAMAAAQEGRKLKPPPEQVPGEKMAYLAATEYEAPTKDGVSEPPASLMAMNPLRPEEIAPIAELPPPREPLVSNSRLMPFLRQALSYRRTGAGIDVDMCVASICRGRSLHAIPLKKRLAWRPALYIINDKYSTTKLYWKDYLDVINHIEAWRGRTGLTVIDALDGPSLSVRYTDDSFTLTDFLKQSPEPGAAVLVLGDMGCVTGRYDHQKAWERLGKQLRKAKCLPIALVTCPPERWGKNLYSYWHMAYWDMAGAMRPPQRGMLLKPRPTAKQHAKELEWRSRIVSEMVLLLSPLVKVEPGLIREVRRTVFSGSTDVVTEYEVWNHPEFNVWTTLAAAMDKQMQKGLRISLFQSKLQDEIVKVAAIAGRHHALIAPELINEELMHFGSISPAAAAAYSKAALSGEKRHPEAIVSDPCNFFARLVSTIIKQDLTSIEDGLYSWSNRAFGRLGSDEAIKCGALLNAVAITHYRLGKKLQLENLPEGIDIRAWQWAIEAPARIAQWNLRQIGLKLYIEESGAVSPKTSMGALIGAFESRVPSCNIIAKDDLGASSYKTANIRIDKAEARSEGIPLYKLLKIGADQGALILEMQPKPPWAVSIKRSAEGLVAGYDENDEKKKRFWFNPGRYEAVQGHSGTGGPAVFTIRHGFWWDGEEYNQWLCKGFCKPDWASAYGTDAYGLYADFSVKNITQRMRWIPPGRFMMGSPESENGRRDKGEILHEVALTHGFWLAETDCIQELWSAVMPGKNPSQFKSPDRPVEQVSWNDCKEFLDALNRLVPGLDVRLPSEAQWEYACRAGTKEATYAGDLEILGECNVPALDPIAWYGGNSGVDFELDNGADSSRWPDKQYPHARAGTHPVKKKVPNSWGLYDMLGNVWEWCEDRYGEYTRESVVDPEGAKTGVFRVLRGGSWRSDGRDLRSAYRNDFDPARANRIVGFRFSRGHIEANRIEILSYKWHHDSGEDEYGEWFEFAYKEAVQRMRWIPPGRFMMGSPKDEPEREGYTGADETQHEVTLTQGYWLADTACTQALWQAVMGKNPSKFKDDPQNPVENVSWDDICLKAGFIEQLNQLVTGLDLRLPTEAQWEYACRAGTHTPFWWGSELKTYKANYDGNYPYADGAKGEYRKKTVPVQTFERNPWGLWQMHGNVYEWCRDWYGAYPKEAVTDPQALNEDARRVLRGGSWLGDGRRLRSASRDSDGPSRATVDYGFRLARYHSELKVNQKAGRA